MKTRIAPTERATLSIAVKTGVVQQCARHWVYYRSPTASPLEQAYRLANYLISRMAKSVRCFKGDRPRFALALKKLLAEMPDHCEHCHSQTMF